MFRRSLHLVKKLSSQSCPLAKTLGDRIGFKLFLVGALKRSSQAVHERA